MVTSLKLRKIIILLGIFKWILFTNNEKNIKSNGEKK